MAKRGKGQPPKTLTDEQKAQVEKLASVLTKAQLADYFGMCENTYRKLENEDSELLEAYKRGKSKAIASVASNLVNQAQKGNTSAAIFYLKTQAGWRETDSSQQDDPKPLSISFSVAEPKSEITVTKGEKAS